MYFEVENTPENIKRKKLTNKHEDEPPKLILAPFTAAPKVMFDNAPIGRVASQTLDVYNPTNKSLLISLIKTPSAELGLNVSEQQFSIQSGETVQLSLLWRPNKTISVRELLHFQDDYRGKYEVIVILKSVAIKKPIKPTGKRSPPKVISKKIVKRNSPIKIHSPPKVISSKVIRSNYMSHSAHPRITQSEFSHSKSRKTDFFVDFHVSDKENSGIKNPFEESYCRPWSLEENDPMCNLTGRATYLVNEPKNKMIARTPPKSALTAIENLEFTPLKSKVDSKNNLKYSNGFTDIYPNKDILGFNTYESDGIEGSHHNFYEKLKNIKHRKRHCNETMEPSPIKYRIVNQQPEYSTDASFEDSLTDEINRMKCSNDTHPIIDLRHVDASITTIPDSPECMTKPAKRIVDLRTPENYDSFMINVAVPLKCGSPAIAVSSPNNNYNAAKPERSRDEFGNQHISVIVNNTRCSHLNDSEVIFDPHRCSTERKEPPLKSPTERISICKGLFINDSFPAKGNISGKHLDNSPKGLGKVSVEKPDSPIIPLDPKNPHNLQSSPYNSELNDHSDHASATAMRSKILTYSGECFLPGTKRQGGRKRSTIDRNCGDNVKNVIEANLWQKSSPKPASPLPLIPEESCLLSETQCLDRKMETFTFNRTYDLGQNNGTFNVSNRSFKTNTTHNTATKTWSKAAAKADSVVWKIPQLQNNEDRIMNPDHLIINAYSTATTIDPFLSTTYFYDEELVDKFEKEFKRWLNCLLTPPAELDVAADGPQIDVGRIWIENRNKEVPEAPTKEQVSNKYHTSHRLDSLRKAARNLLTSDYIMTVFVKLSAQIDKKLLSMRPDKNLHLDVGLQKIIMDLLLCYNPLWLRMGLEAIYGTIIPLSSNNDILGLSTFIIQRMFRDPYMRSKQAQPTLPNMITPQYTEYMRKFTLKKFFMLVYFLDQAKQKKLICHDPCLFCRTAPYKESREMLIRFTREVITGVGDITKHLRPLGYVVTHKQSDLDEFKYAVHNLAVDLKDGVRLTRLMEIILVKEGLTSRLRVPAISRLQKVHNVKLALNALNEAGFNIVGDITAKDISDGHREKTLSLLWQIIHKFRAPLFVKAASAIQLWWRKKYLKVWIKNRTEKKKQERLSRAAVKIQSQWRGHSARKLYAVKLFETVTACVIIQKNWRMRFYKMIYVRTQRAAVIIQKWYRRKKEIKDARQDLRLRRVLLYSAIAIQRWCRKLLVIKKLLAVRALYQEYCLDTRMKIKSINIIKRSLRSYIIHKKLQVLVCAVLADEVRRKMALEMRNKCATLIQANYRGHVQRKRFAIIRESVVKLQAFSRGFMLRSQLELFKYHVVRVQQLYRAKLLMRKAFREYRFILVAAVRIQAEWRMHRCHSEYALLRKSIVNVQRRYRANLAMNRQRQIYMKIRSVIVKAQAAVRRTLACRTFSRMKMAAILMQRSFRAYKLRQLCVSKFNRLKKSSIILQKYWRRAIAVQRFNRIKRVVISLQRRFRANREMRRCQADYKRAVRVIRFIQARYKATLLMRRQKEEYLAKRKAASCVQSRRRALIAMRNQHDRYIKIKESILKIQIYFRATLESREVRSRYLQLKQVCLALQVKLRARNEGRRWRQQFLQLKQSAVVIQRRYRCCRLTKRLSDRFKKIRTAAVTVQVLYRSKILMKIERCHFLKKKSACLSIQRWFRATRQMRLHRCSYLTLRRSCVVIQNRFRANRNMKFAAREYCRVRASCLFVQRRYRANKLSHLAIEKYARQRKACLSIQRHFRAYTAMRMQRNRFSSLKSAAVTIQQRYRATKLMKLWKSHFFIIRKAVILIQTRFRAHRAMRAERSLFLAKQKAVIHVQRRYRATVNMRKIRTNYQNIRKACIYLQEKIRAHLLMKRTRNDYLKLKRACAVIKSHYLALLAGKKQREIYLKMKASCSNIQQWYRSLVEMIRIRNHYLQMKTSCIKIQCWVRAVRAMRTQRRNYEDQKRAIVCLQRKYRAKKLTMRAVFEYRNTRRAVIYIQRWYRALRIMLAHKEAFAALRRSAVSVQARYRSVVAMRKQRALYLKLKSSVLKMQTRYKGKLLMRKRRNEFLIIRSHVLFVQRQFRYKKLMQVQRQLFIFQRQCTVKIQTYYRMFVEQRNYLRIKRSTGTIQSYYRRLLLARRARERFLHIKLCVVRIQAAVRCFLIRKKYLQIQSAVLVVQAVFRQKKAIINARNTRARVIRGIIMLQAWARRYLARRRYVRKMTAVLCVQRFYRSVLLMRAEREHYLRLQRTIVSVQAAARGYLIRSYLLKIKEQLLIEKEQEKLRRAALKIQAVWRGYSVRSEYQDARVINLRKRWKEGALESNQETLAERNEDALEVLNHFSDMASVIRAFLSLDLLTRVYPMMYEKEGMGRTVSEKLILYMSATNRSISSLETLRLSVSILVNLTKYKATAHFVYSKTHVHIILTLMMRWCDKDSQFFRFLGTLIWLFGNNELIRKELCDDLAQGDNLKMLQKIRASVERKTRMEERTRRNNATQPPARWLNASLNASRLNGTLSVSNANILPSPKPDYGIPQAHKPRVFQNDLQVVQNVFRRYDLK